MSNYFHVFTHLLNRNVILHVGSNDYRDAYKYIRKLNILPKDNLKNNIDYIKKTLLKIHSKETPYRSGFSFVINTYNGKRIYFINITSCDVNSIEFIGTLSHECVHITERISENLGIKDEETKAYTQNFLLEEFLKQLWNEDKMKSKSI